MISRNARINPALLPLAALILVSGLASAAQPPRVMFVSGADLQPVLIDASGKEVLVKKGTVIPPGFTVKVPAGATVQIMTEEKAILAVRPDSLLKLEQLGTGEKPNRYRLDNGGLRVANSDKTPARFEVDTPNAKVRFDKGDHETYYLKNGNKLTGDRWGTFQRGFKGESLMTTKDGDTRVDTTKVGYVDGKNGLPELIDRPKLGNSPLSNPITGPGKPISTIRDNQDVLSDAAKPPVADLPPIVRAPLTVPLLPVAYAPKSAPDPLLAPLPPIAKLDPIQPVILPPTRVKPQILVDPVTKTAFYADDTKVQQMSTTPELTKQTTITLKEATTSPTALPPSIRNQLIIQQIK